MIIHRGTANAKSMAGGRGEGGGEGPTKERGMGPNSLCGMKCTLVLYSIPNRYFPLIQKNK